MKLTKSNQSSWKYVKLPFLIKLIPKFQSLELEALSFDSRGQGFYEVPLIPVRSGSTPAIFNLHLKLRKVYNSDSGQPEWAWMLGRVWVCEASVIKTQLMFAVNKVKQGLKEKK